MEVLPGGPDGEGPAYRGTFKGEKKMLKLARTALVVAALAVAAFLTYHAYSPALALSPAGRDLIRLHIIANSDSVQDQALKLKVRDQLLAETGALFSGAKSEEEAEHILATHLTEVEQVANKVLAQAGASYRGRAEVGVYSFPERTYGSLTLPAGRYRALRVVLGRGEGANWWCVLFPPLCFVDASGGPEVAAVTAPAPGTGPAPRFEIRFKLAEVFSRLGRRVAALSAEPAGN